MARDVSVFLTYAFRPRQQAYSRSEIVTAIERACSTARSDLQPAWPDIRFNVTAELSEYGGFLNQEIMHRLQQADICIVEVSDNNPNVFYELGVIHALGKPAVLLKSERNEEDFRVPSDVVGVLLLKYETVSDIQGRLAEYIVRATRQVFSMQSSTALARCHAFWGAFGSRGSSVALVGPRSSSRTTFSSLKSRNFIHLDRLGDKDALVELSILMARLYPELSIVRYISDELPRDGYEQNLILVGGPGGPGTMGNVLVQTVQERLGIAVRYSDDCERLYTPDGTEWSAEFAGKLVRRDHGVFAKASNPFNSEKKVVLVHGIHTFGVLGAARCFSDHPAAEPNRQLIIDKLGEDPSFWTYFSVDVVGGVPMVPKVEADRVFRL